jgi:hypothetical protein
MPILQKKFWSQSLPIAQSDSGEDSVFKIKVGHSDMILKLEDYDRDTDFALNELVIGSVLNKLKEEIPTFAYIFGGFSSSAPRKVNSNTSLCECSDPRAAVNYTLQEYIQGRPLDSYFREKVPEISLIDLWRIIRIVHFSLLLANKRYKFVHRDLHRKNILIEDLGQEYIINIDGIETISSYLPIIIDYARSAIMIDGVFYGTKPATMSADEVVNEEWQIERLLGAMESYDKGENVIISDIFGLQGEPEILFDKFNEKYYNPIKRKYPTLYPDTTEVLGHNIASYEKIPKNCSSILIEKKNILLKRREISRLVREYELDKPLDEDFFRILANNIDAYTTENDSIIFDILSQQKTLDHRLYAWYIKRKVIKDREKEERHQEIIRETREEVRKMLKEKNIPEKELLETKGLGFLSETIELMEKEGEIKVEKCFVLV